MSGEVKGRFFAEMTAQVGLRQLHQINRSCSRILLPTWEENVRVLLKNLQQIAIWDLFEIESY
jgi:hypothetical protein